MADQDAEFRAAVARLHEAMSRVAAGDVKPIKALQSSADDVTTFFGFGGYEQGSSAVMKRWDWTTSQFHGGWATYENLASYVSGDIGYSIDIETLHLIVEGKPDPVERYNRVTHIFRREKGGWMLVHRHASRLEKKAAR